MKSKIFISAVLLVCIATLALPLQSVAQNKRVGTASASQLLIPVGARGLAMGSANIALARGIEAIHWNPAGLGRLEHSAEGLFSTMSYIADIQVNYGAVAGSFGEFGVVGFSMKSIDFGDILLTTDDDPEGRLGRLFSPTFMTLGFSYARELTDAISAGATLKLITENIDRVSASGVAFDFGIQYKGLAGVPGLHFGVAVKNIGPQMKYDGPGLLRPGTSSEGRRPEQMYKSEAASFELPSLFEIGTGYTLSPAENVMLGFAGTFTNNNLYVDEYRVGGEVAYTLASLQLFGRAGLGVTPVLESKENIFGMTLGMGVSYRAEGIHITFDYAYRQVEFFDANQVISLKLGF